MATCRRDDDLEPTGRYITASEVHQYLSERMYESRMDPFWNEVVVCGRRRVSELPSFMLPPDDPRLKDIKTSTRPRGTAGDSMDGSSDQPVEPGSSSSSESVTPVSSKNDTSGLPRRARPRDETALYTGFVGYVDRRGSRMREEVMATGYGAYLALPLLRDQWKPLMSEAEARKLLGDCMRVLWYRDCCASDRIQFARVSTSGVAVVDEAIRMKDAKPTASSRV